MRTRMVSASPGAGLGRRRLGIPFFAACLLAAFGMTSCGDQDMIARAARSRKVIELSHGNVDHFHGVGAAGPKRSVDRIPGDFLSDLLTAVEEGSDSGLLYLETGREEEAFSLWASMLIEKDGLDGLTLYRMEDHGDVRVYEASMPELGFRFLLKMQHTDDRWRVVGVKRLN